VTYLIEFTCNIKRRDDSVGIAKRLNDQGVRIRFLEEIQENVLFSITSTPGLGPIQPPIQWVPVAVPHWVKRQDGEPGHSHPSTAKAENDGAIPPLPIRVHGVLLN
jgi:hypothetical protein